MGTKYKRCTSPRHKGPNPLPVKKFHRQKRNGSQGRKSRCIVCSKWDRREADERRAQDPTYRKPRKTKRRKNINGSYEVHCRIDDDLRRGISFIAEVRRMSKSAVIQEAVRAYLINEVPKATRERHVQGRSGLAS